MVTTLLLVWHTTSSEKFSPENLSPRLENLHLSPEDIDIAPDSLSPEGHSPNRDRSILGEIPDFSNRGLLQAMAGRNSKRKKSQVPSPSVGTQYIDPHCPEGLGAHDMRRWSTCTYLAEKVNQNETLTHKCHFISKPVRDPVGLVSLPGSGNTWVRGLLETATGICTGAVYCDISLRARGFIGEYIRSGHVLVVKTHTGSPMWSKGGMLNLGGLKDNVGIFGSAILLIRNPFDSLVAEWNRKVANKFRVRTIELDSHIKAAGREWFGECCMSEDLQ